MSNTALTVEFRPASLSVLIRSASVQTGFGDTTVIRSYETRPAYTGAYTVTPSGQTQVLATDGLRMTGDVTVNPIPSNYGLISWNGSVLTVS